MQQLLLAVSIGHSCLLLPGNSKHLIYDLADQHKLTHTCYPISLLLCYILQHSIAVGLCGSSNHVLLNLLSASLQGPPQISHLFQAV